MDPTLIKTFTQLGTYGPLGIMAALGFWLFVQERKKTAELTTKLMEFAKASLAAEAEHTKAMEALGNLYELSMESTKVSTEMINGLDAVNDSLKRVEEEVRRPYEPKRR